MIDLVSSRDYAGPKMKSGKSRFVMSQHDQPFPSFSSPGIFLASIASVFIAFAPSFRTGR